MNDLHAEVLRFCNEIRQGHGLSHLEALQRGDRCDSYCCPITNTIKHGSSLEVKTSTEVVRVGEEKYLLTDEVCRFIQDFDNGKLPELIDHE